MTVLPHEVLERIISYADRDTHWNLLTVSRIAQAAVERTYWKPWYTLDGSKIEHFLGLYRDHRVKLLQGIIFNFSSPFIYIDHDRNVACCKSEKELEIDDKRFTNQILDLFTAIKILEERDTYCENRAPRITLSIRTPEQHAVGFRPCEHHRYHSWRLHLLNPKSLPSLSSICALEIGEMFRWRRDLYGSYERPLDMRVVVDLLTKLPNASKLECLYLNDEFPCFYSYPVAEKFVSQWQGPRRDSRHDFGMTMREAIHRKRLPGALKSVKLFFGRADGLRRNRDQGKGIPNLTGPLSYDPLSSSIRLLSQHLVELDIRGCVDETLFWPSKQESQTEFAELQPYWPCLRWLHVEFLPESPSGAWYFQGPRGEGCDSVGYQVTQANYPPMEDKMTDEDINRPTLDHFDSDRRFHSGSDLFRIRPIDCMIESLLVSFARALGGMPLLEEAELITFLTWCPSLVRAQEYPKPPCGPVESPFRRWGLKALFQGTTCLLKWQVGSWRPSEDTLVLFRSLASEYHRKHLQEEWIEGWEHEQVGGALAPSW